METIQNITGVLVNSLLTPLLMIVIPALLFIAKNYAEKVVASIVEKNEKESTKCQIEATSKLFDNINMVVEAAVANNMPYAKKLKESHTDGKLTIEDISELKKSAFAVIHGVLPDSITSKDGLLSQTLGGSVDVDALIESLIEKYVINEKNAAAHQQ